MTGFLVSVSMLASMLAAPMMGKYMGKFGKKNTIMMAFVISVTSTIGLVLSSFISNAFVFYGVTLIIRLVQGTGDSCTQSPILSLVTILFPIDTERFLGYCETAIGVGFAIGPIMGAEIHRLGGKESGSGYRYTLLFYICTITTSGIICFFLMPKSLNRIELN